MFEKKNYWSAKFNENPFCGSRVVACGRTDRHSIYLNFAETAKKKKHVGYKRL